MKRHSIFCAGIWPFFLFPFLLLLLVLFFKWHDIEEKVAANAASELSTQESWVAVDTHNLGRGVLLSGTAPNEQAVQSAINAASQGNGVRKVEFVGDIVKPITKLPELGITFSEGSIVLNGVVGTRSEIDQIVSSVKSKFSGMALINNLDLGPRKAPSNSWSGVIGSLSYLGNGGTVAIDGDNLTLIGKLKSQQHRNAIEQQVRKEFDGTIDNQLRVEAPKNTCESQIANLLTTAKVNFDSGKAIIRSDSDALIESLVSTMKQCPYKNFEVSGHTDNTGGLEANVILSERRAQALVNRLIDLGLNQSRFSSKGFGPNAPIADNSTKSGRAENRRIEFKVTN